MRTIRFAVTAVAAIAGGSSASFAQQTLTALPQAQGDAAVSTPYWAYPAPAAERFTREDLGQAAPRRQVYQHRARVRNEGNGAPGQAQ